jgi:hypothetical protein
VTSPRFLLRRFWLSVGVDSEFVESVQQLSEVETEAVRGSNPLGENTVTRLGRPLVVFLSVILWFATIVAAADWPMLSGSDISEWANTLRPYKVTEVSIIYDKREDGDVVVAIGKAMKQAGWPAPTLAGEQVPISTGIADSQFSEPAATALQALFEKQFGVRPEIKEYTVHSGYAFISLYIGRRTNAQRRIRILRCALNDTRKGRHRKLAANCCDVAQNPHLPAAALAGLLSRKITGEVGVGRFRPPNCSNRDEVPHLFLVTGCRGQPYEV